MEFTNTLFLTNENIKKYKPFEEWKYVFHFCVIVPGI